MFEIYKIMILEFQKKHFFWQFYIITESVLARKLLAREGHVVEGADFSSTSNKPSRNFVRTSSEPSGKSAVRAQLWCGWALMALSFVLIAASMGAHGRVLGAHGRVLGGHGRVFGAHGRVLGAHRR